MGPLYEGDIVHVSGDSCDLWINDYNVRVDTDARVDEYPTPRAKKVRVTLFNIDGDSNVSAYVKRSALSLVTPSYSHLFPGGLDKCAEKAVRSICDENCVSPCKCGRTKKLPLMRSVGPEMTCPLEKYDVPDRNKNIPWYRREVLHKNEVLALCVKCDRAAVDVSPDSIQVKPKDFMACIDCPVQSTLECIQEAEAEARYS